jgi:WD40 repeat protein
LAWGPDGKLYTVSDDGTIRVWADGGGTIFKTPEYLQDSLAWVDGNLFAASYQEIWVWSSEQLGPTDPPSHVLDGAVCGDWRLTSGSSGDLYAVAGSAIVKM